MFSYYFVIQNKINNPHVNLCKLNRITIKNSIQYFEIWKKLFN